MTFCTGNGWRIRRESRILRSAGAGQSCWRRAETADVVNRDGADGDGRQHPEEQRALHVLGAERRPASEHDRQSGRGGWTAVDAYCGRLARRAVRSPRPRDRDRRRRRPRSFVDATRDAGVFNFRRRRRPLGSLRICGNRDDDRIPGLVPSRRRVLVPLILYDVRTWYQLRHHSEHCNRHNWATRSIFMGRGGGSLSFRGCVRKNQNYKLRWQRLAIFLEKATIGLGVAFTLLLTATIRLWKTRLNL